MDPMGVYFVDPNLYHNSVSPFIFLLVFFAWKKLEKNKKHVETNTNQFPALIFLSRFFFDIFLQQKPPSQQKTWSCFKTWTTRSKKKSVKILDMFFFVLIFFGMHFLKVFFLVCFFFCGGNGVPLYKSHQICPDSWSNKMIPFKK